MKRLGMMANGTFHIKGLRPDIRVEADGGRVMVYEPTRRGYLPDGAPVTVAGRLQWGGSVAVDVLTLHSTGGEVTAASSITRRRVGEDSAELVPGKDGWFTVSHIVIPDREWVEEQLDGRRSLVRTYDDIWYADGNGVWELSGGKAVSRDIASLLEHGADGMTVLRADVDRFLLSDVTDALDAAFSERIVSMLGGSGCQGDMCRATTLLHAANLIAHHVRTGMLAEAQRVGEIAYRYVEGEGGGNAKAAAGCFSTLRKGCGCHDRV